MVKVGDKVTYNGRDAYVTVVHSETSVDLVQDGMTHTSVTNFEARPQPLSPVDMSIPPAGSSGKTPTPINKEETVVVKRFLGLEEVEVKVNKQTLKVLDKNDRRLEIGLVVHLPVRITAINDADSIEVVYPPNVATPEQIPEYHDGKLVNSDDSLYVGSTYKLNDKNEVVNVNTGLAPVEVESVEEHKLDVKANLVERF